MEQQDSTDWDFEVDLDFIKSWLTAKSATETDRASARNFITACVKLARKSDTVPANGQMINETTGNVVKNALVVPSRNPFEMEDILTGLFSYVPMSSLLTFRLVNQTWNERAVSVIRKNHKLVEVKSTDMQRFFTDFKKTIVFPFSKLGLELRDVSLEEYSKFFIKHGTDIRSLTICESKSEIPKNEKSSRENLRKLKFILKHVPNLTSISLDLQVIPDLSDSDLFNEAEAERMVLHQVESLELKAVTSLSGIFLNNLFTMLPNVRELASILLPEDQDLKSLTEAFQKLKLRSISIPPYFTPIRLLGALGRTQKLKMLSLVLETKRMDHEGLELFRALEELLESQAEYLENLNLLYHYNSENSSAVADELTLPVMKNLKSLSFHVELKDFYKTQYGSRFPMVSVHSRQVPKLETLSIPPWLLGKFFANSIFTTVREVNFVTKRLNISSDELHHVASVFPNLKKLTGLCTYMTDYSESAMNWIVKTMAMANIEELEWKILRFPERVIPTPKINFSISGVPLEVKWLLEQVTGRLGILSSIEPPRSSLRDLRRLTSLKLSFDSYRGRNTICIDEVGVYSTFLRLSPQLRLTLEGDFTISSDLAAKLTDYFQTVCLNPNPKPRVTPAVNSDSDSSSDMDTSSCTST